MPSKNSGTPKVYRAVPVSTSVPARPKRRPTKIIAIALISEPRANTTAESRPSTINEKYSTDVNFWENAARIGANPVMTKVPTQPAKKEPSAETASAGPARPCRAIWWPSRQVTIDDTSPGMLTRMDVVEPPY